MRDRLDAHRADLVEAFERLTPREDAYAPLSLFFNFSHNVVKGLVVDAALRADPWDVSLNDLLTSLPAHGGSDEPPAASSWSRQRIHAATSLMGHARRSPDRIGGRLMPAIVYDPRAGHQGYAYALRKLKE